MAIRSRETRDPAGPVRRRSLTFQIHQEALRDSFVQHLPAWLIVMGILGIILPHVIGGVIQVTVGAAGALLQAVPQAVTGVFESFGGLFQGRSSGSIAPLFTASVAHWSGDIERWAQDHDLDPNLLATVMQIESCGHPTISSVAGAQGLFQVMPFHFASNENQTDPETNALRGAAFLNDCLGWANGDPGRAMACYNGGPSVLQKPFNQWAAETQRYFNWGTGIYADAQANRSSSTTLDQWLVAGGSGLCARAADAVGISG